ncbi:ferredoxin [Streptomyces sp. J2-1]|uniref:ferredoxin n=1 Tax=Streptomyces corallincola TaxID=2851888 RepID=UPI001C3879E6|nr:ferredoxin [Streptomyces corallincola]MBV2352967.1 ferredoxin [Streptomyces corallincola]
MTPQTSPQQLYRYLEDRFACAQACTECARACAVRASLQEPDGSGGLDQVRRLGIMCAEVCDATCRVLSEESEQDLDGVRVHLEWCRSVCLDCAHAFDAQPGAESAAAACRACAAACTDFMATFV